MSSSPAGAASGASAPARRRRQEPGSPGRLPQAQLIRQQRWAGQTPQQILARYRPGRASPLDVLEVLLTLFNAQHTAMEKTVSHKTRQERAQFLRRFFRDLHLRAGFKTLPDPRNLGQKHLRAMVAVWQEGHLKPATIQTYLSFIRGLAMWTGKHGLVREPAYYGLALDEYERHESAQRDHSWSAGGVDIDALIDRVAAHDPYVGASVRLVRALGLRRKESVQFRPFQSIVAFECTGLQLSPPPAERYARIQGKGGRVRYVPIDSPARVEAIALAQQLVGSRDAHMGDPARDLKQNLRRFDNVLRKFGISMAQLGITAHGLRHEVLIDHYTTLTGHAPPVRGGAGAPSQVDLAARKEVAALAGHARLRSAAAYLGAVKPLWGRTPGGSSRDTPPKTSNVTDPDEASHG